MRKMTMGKSANLRFYGSLDPCGHVNLKGCQCRAGEVIGLEVPVQPSVRNAFADG